MVSSCPEPLRLSKWVAIAFSFLCLTCLLAGAEKKKETTPPRAEWKFVKDIDEEFDFVRQQRCPCGGRLEVAQQALRAVGDAQCDVLYCRCTTCNSPRQFYFDVTELVRQREWANSKSAEAKTYAGLDRQYPRITAELIPQLKQLLSDRNPHRRTWAAKHLARMGTPEAAEILLDAYLRAPLLDQLPFEEGLEQMGKVGLQSIGKRLVVANSDCGTCFSLLSLLDRFPDPQAARWTEDQLRQALQLPSKTQLTRVCYLNLGRLGFKESMPLLLEAERQEAPMPDEALLWALARCGGAQSIPLMRKYSRSSDRRLQAAALAGLGIAGDRESIPRLMEVARTTRDYDLRHNSIYALGCLKATEAVPLLLELLRPDPNYGAHFSPAGLFGKEDGYTTQAGTEVCIRTLGRIGDRRVLSEFRRLLKNDQHYLEYEEVAKVAANLGWRDLVPDIIDRLEKDYQYNVNLFGKDRERYSPYLRKLTGQKFGEDPKAWRSWQKSQSK